nr:hypothetical protein [Caldilineaceae bacterium]
VIIHPGPQENEKTAAELYANHMEMRERLLSGYSDEQISFILEFVRRLVSINYEVAGKEQESPLKAVAP